MVHIMYTAGMRMPFANLGVRGVEKYCSELSNNVQQWLQKVMRYSVDLKKNKKVNVYIYFLFCYLLIYTHDWTWWVNPLLAQKHIVLMDVLVVHSI